jgi:melibiose permease
LSSNTDATDIAGSVGGNVIGLRMTMTVIPIIGLLIAVFYFNRKYVLNEVKMQEIRESIKQG